MIRLHSELKNRDITLPTKVYIAQAMVFPVVMYGCESWTIKKAQHWRIDAFDLWCWRRHLRVFWTARRSSQSTLKEISSEYSLEGLMLKLKLQYFGHVMGRANSLEMTLMLGKIKGRRKGGQQRMNGWMSSPTQWSWVWANSGSWWWTGKPGVLQSTDWVTEQQYRGETKENWATCQNNQILSLSYRLQLKTKQRVGGSGLGLERERRPFTWRW